jgi:hypothetical protein
MNSACGPIRGIYRKLGVLGGDWLVVSGSERSTG